MFYECFTCRVSVTLELGLHQIWRCGENRVFEVHCRWNPRRSGCGGFHLSGTRTPLPAAFAPSDLVRFHPNTINSFILPCCRCTDSAWVPACRALSLDADLYIYMTCIIHGLNRHCCRVLSEKSASWIIWFYWQLLKTMLRNTTWYINRDTDFHGP